MSDLLQELTGPSQPQHSDLIDVIDENGDIIGYIPYGQALKENFPILIIEDPPRWKEDPYVLWHSDMAYERGLLSHGQDLNEIQKILLASYMVRSRERENTLRETQFMESLFVADPERYQQWLKAKQQREAQEAISENTVWMAPQSPQELLEVLKQLGAESPSPNNMAGNLAREVFDKDFDQIGTTSVVPESLRTIIPEEKWHELR